MDEQDVPGVLKDLRAGQERLAEVIESRRKDGWDKFAILSGFVSSVVLVVVGGAFTFFFDRAQKADRELQATEARKIEEHRTRTAELDALTGLLPHLASDDERKKRLAFLALNTLASTDVVIKFARLQPSRAATEALTAIGAGGSVTPEQRDQVEAALKELFRIYRQSVVKLDFGSGFGSGFFVSREGHILTADFVVNQGSDRLEAVLADGRRYPATLARRGISIGGTARLPTGVAIVKVDYAPPEPLKVGASPPRDGDQIVVVGSTPDAFLVPAFGKIVTVSDVEFRYARGEESLAGFGGGPLLNARSEVIGMALGYDRQTGEGIAQRLDNLLPTIAQVVNP